MKVFIGCASSDDIPDIYNEDCEKLINRLMENNDLVYGAYNKGLMGMCFNEAKSHNRRVTGIAPKTYQKDLEGLDCDKKILTDTIIDRTKSLMNECDAVLFLPGGIGTIHELFVCIDSKRSNEFNKPIIIYNSNHYYDKLLEFLDKLYSEEFTSSSVKECYFVTNNIDEVVKYL